MPNMAGVQGRDHISFHVDIENEISCHERGLPATFLSFS